MEVLTSYTLNYSGGWSVTYVPEPLQGHSVEVQRIEGDGLFTRRWSFPADKTHRPTQRNGRLFVKRCLANYNASRDDINEKS